MAEQLYVTSVGDIISSFGAVTIALIGIPIAIAQLRRLNHTVKNAAIASLYDRSQDIRKIFLEKPELRKFFFDNVEIGQDHEHYHVVVTIAELYLNLQEQKTVLKNDIGKEWDSWKESRDGFIASSPVMQRILREKPERYSKDLVRLVKAK